MIHVIAILVAKPDLRAQVLELFAENRPNVLAEKGCIEYVATIDAQGMPANKGTFGADTLVVIEKWATLADLQAHSSSTHMAEFGAKTRELVASRVIHVMEPVA